MNIQIFGTLKNFDTKKAVRYFKERSISVQFINLKEKEMSKTEFTKISLAVGGFEKMIDNDSKDQDTLMLIKYLSPEDRFLKVLENQQIFKLPIVRNGSKATIGYQPDIWKEWK